MLVRQVWRRARVDRVSSGVAALSLAVGLGLTTAALSLFEVAVRQPLAVPDPDRVVNITGAAHPRGTSVEDWFGRAPSLQGIASFRVGRAAVRIDGLDALAHVAEVSGSFFDVMGIRPVLGRLFGREAEGARAAVIGHALWQQRFGGSPDVLRRFISIGTIEFAIVAVAPPRFSFPGDTEVWVRRPDTGRFVVVDLDMTEVAEGSFPMPTGIVARVREGADLPHVTAQVAELQREYERTRAQPGLVPSVVRVRDLGGTLSARARPTVLVFLAACLGLFAAAAASFAHFAVVRTLARRDEFAVRRALGASSARLYGLLLADHGLLGVVGLAGGALIAWASLRVLSAWLPSTVPNARTLTLEGVALAAAAVLTLAVIAAAGAPAIRLGDPATLARGSGTQGSAPRRVGRWVRDGLLVVQWSATLALLVATLLLSRSLHRLQQVNLGFDPGAVLTAEVRLPGARGGPSGKVAAWHHLLNLISAEPETAAVAVTDRLPLATREPGRQHVGAGQRETFAVVTTVSPAYFDALSIPLLAGRGFTPVAVGARGGDVVVNQAAVAALGIPPGTVGWTLELEGRAYTVAGIAGNTIVGGTDEAPVPQVYLPLGASGAGGDVLFVAVRGRTAVPPLARRLGAIVRDVDPAGTVSRLRPMSDIVARVHGPPTLRAFVVAVLAVAATLIAGFGTYASVSLTVSQRWLDLAIRSALGCPPGALARHVVATVATPLGLGLPIGLVLAVSSASAMRALLFGVAPADMGSLAAAVGVVMVATALALAGPLHRVLRMDVAAVLRGQ